jgi:ParB/RepB/Spo0J family partition protein
MTATALPPVEAPTRVQTSGMAAPKLELLAFESLRESPQNTRKHFDPAKLDELRKSIEKSGILTPLLVRPRSKGPDRIVYEIAAGHRRYRAGKMAGAEFAPCIVREMDDATFLEILTIENLQREDVHPLEEAQGYRNLLALDGYDIAKLADKVGKSQSYIYDRLKLLQLTKDAQKLFLDGRITAGHAILLARLGAEDQARAIAHDNRNSYGNARSGGLWEHEGPAHPALGLPTPEDNAGGLKAVSVRELQAWIDHNVRFDERSKDVPQLWPATAAAIQDVRDMQLKAIKITRSYHVDPEAKDPNGERTYGPMSWKRADGNPEPDRGGAEKPSKECEYSVLGIVAVGEGRGESFKVCIDKKRCTVHYGTEIRERNRREKEREAAPASHAKAAAKGDGLQPWQREQKAREEKERIAKERWAKGGPAVLTAVAAHVKKLPLDANGPTAKWLWEQFREGTYGIDDAAKTATKLGVPRGTTAADFLRHLVMSVLVSFLDDDYNREQTQKDLDALKIKVDITKLLDAASPAPAQPKASKKAGAR